MPFERLIDSHGSTTDSEGVPYNEIFSQREGRRLNFEVYRTEGSDLIQSDATADKPIVAVPEQPVKKISPRRGKTAINYSPGI